LKIESIFEINKKICFCNKNTILTAKQSILKSDKKEKKTSPLKITSRLFMFLNEHRGRGSGWGPGGGVPCPGRGKSQTPPLKYLSTPWTLPPKN
jgi:hypothetical protein